MIITSHYRARSVKGRTDVRDVIIILYYLYFLHLYIGYLGTWVFAAKLNFADLIFEINFAKITKFYVFK